MPASTGHRSPCPRTCSSLVAVESAGGELEERLTQLGALDAESIQIYLRVLKSPVRSSEIDAAFGRRRARLARRQLIDIGAVLDRRTKDGLTIFAMPPERVWVARQADVTWRRATSLRPIHELADTEDELHDRARQLCSEIGELAAQLYVPADVLPLRYTTALRSSASIANALNQLVHQADEQVMAMSARPHLPQVSTVWEALSKRLMENSLRYRRIVEVGTVVQDGLAIVRRDVRETGVDLAVADPRQVTTTMWVFDRNALLHEVASGDGYVYTDKRRVGSAFARIDQASRTALPGLDVADALQLQADEMSGKLEELPDRAGWWFRQRVNYGRFAGSPPDWPAGERRRVEQILFDAGLLRKDAEGLWPAYQLNQGAISRKLREHERRYCGECWKGAQMCTCDAA